MQRGGGEIGELLHKKAKGLSCFQGLSGGFHRLIGANVFHIDVGTPVVALIVLVEAVAISGRNQDEHLARDVRFLGSHEFLADMSRHPIYIVHHLQGLGEDLAIDLLMDVAHFVAPLLIGRRVGLVDVTNLTWLSMQNLTIDMKTGGNIP